MLGVPSSPCSEFQGIFPELFYMASLLLAWGLMSFFRETLRETGAMGLPPASGTEMLAEELTLTAAVAGVCRWMTQRTSGLAA